MKIQISTAVTGVCLFFSYLLQGQVTFNADDLKDIAKGERKVFAMKQLQWTPETTANYDVKWYRCRWNINPAVNEISGDVTTLFFPTGPGIDSLNFDLNQALVVDSVNYHHNSAPWSHVSDVLTIHFPAILLQNSADSVTVYYHGVPPDNGFGSFAQGNHNGTPIIWTLSEPYGSSDWWPCKNGLTDKADSIDIYIRTPAAYKTASNGLLISETAAGADVVHHWKHRYPIASYLVCLAVTNYARFTQQVPYNNDTLPVVNYVYPEDSASAVAQTAAIIPMIQLFDTLFGVYPFQNEKYGHAQFGWGGGMEHQTMTFVSSFGFELIAHELAHMWFGDKVTCGSWTDIWLNEGFATYLSGLCYEHLAPVYWQQFREGRVKSITNYPGGSVYCPDTTSVARIFDGRLSYAKGAMILHQLRWIMGDSVFFAALNNYLSDVSLGYGFARTSDLKSHLENAFGQDLTWYFNDWFTGEGFPSYQVNWAQTNDSVTFTVQQTQSHPSVPFFEMVIPVQFKDASHDTIIRFSNTYSGQSFTVFIPFKADSVIFDPECQLISRNNIVNTVADHPRQHGLQIFPNPATDEVTFRFMEFPGNQAVTISIYDHSGKLAGEYAIAGNTTEITVNTCDYSPGLYIYVIRKQEVLASGKLMIIND